MSFTNWLKRRWRRHEEGLQEEGLYAEAIGPDHGAMLGDAPTPIGIGLGGMPDEAARIGEPETDESVLREAERVEESREE
jgi:hypothetical protein